MKSIVEFFNPIINTIKDIGLKALEQRGLEEAAGLESAEMNPDDFLDKKGKDLTFYDAMMKDDRIKLAIEAKKTIVLSVTNKVVAVSDRKEDIEKAEFAQEVIDGMKIRWRDVLKNMLDAMVYGFKVGEIIWKISKDAKWVWHNIKFMHSVFYDFTYEENKDLKSALIGRDFGSDQEIDAETYERKFIHHINSYLKDGNLYGDSDLKELYPQWNAKQKIFRYRNVYIQNSGYSMPVVKYDKATVDDTEKTEMITYLKNLQDQMFLMIPAIRDKNSGELRGKFEVDFRDTGTKDGTSIHNEAITQLDKQITRKLLMPDRLGFTDESNGSEAMTRKIFDLFIMIIKDLQKDLEDTINPHIRRLIDFNFPGTVDYPTWEFEEVDEGIETEALKALIELGVIDKREKWIRSFVGIPEISRKEQKAIEKEKQKAVEDAQKNMVQNGDNDGNGNNGGDTNTNTNTNDGNNNGNQNGQKKNGNQKVEFKTSSAPVNFKGIIDTFDSLEDQFIDDFAILHEENIEAIINQIDKSKVIETGDISDLEKLSIKKRDFKRLFNIYYNELYMNGHKDAVVEIKPRLEMSGLDVKLQAIQFDDKWLDKGFLKNLTKELGSLGALTKEDKKFLKSLSDRSFIDAGELENKMTQIAERTVSNGLRNGLSGSVIKEQVKLFLREDRKRFATTIARTNASTDYNSGRMNFFTGETVDQFTEAFQYSAVIDQDTTDFCAQHDGQIIKKSDPEFETVNPPNHFSCRSLFIPVLVGDNENPDSFYNGYQDNKTEFPDWGTRVTKDNRLPNKGFGGV